MRVFYGFDQLPEFRNPVVTVGSYDGVHVGHRAILKRVGLLAKECGGESVVVTFSPHPREILGDITKVELLTTFKEKLMLLDDAEIDNVIVIPFTKEFSRVSSYSFIKDHLISKIGIKHLVVGFDHHFGCNKEGDFSYLDSLKSEFGIDVAMVEEQNVDERGEVGEVREVGEVGEGGGGNLSSTSIRELIKRGEFREARSYLGYPYFFIATAVEREENCFELVDIEPTKLLPSEGEYEVYLDARGGEKSERGVLKVLEGRKLHLYLKRCLVGSEELIVTLDKKVL